MSLVDQTKKERFLFIKIESTIINHGGTGNLTLHFLETSNCDCKKFYNGEHDKLVRTSAAPSKLRSNFNFGLVIWLPYLEKKARRENQLPHKCS